MPPREDTQTESNTRKLYEPSPPFRRRASRTDSETSSNGSENEGISEESSFSGNGTDVDNRRTTNNDLIKKDRRGLSPTVSLPILVFIDMFAVSLVVPLLFQYYKNAGVTSANQRELLSSVFSSSQIVGGMALGAMADARFLKRKTILYVSFGGSALAYASIAFGGFHALIFSRILVGLVKQTMTVTSSILTTCTGEHDRAKYMGRLQSSATASWIVGPSVGAILYKYVDPRAPALLACSLFLLNVVLAAVLLSDDIEEETTDQNNNSNNTDRISEENDEDAKKKNTRRRDSSSSFWMNLKECFRSQALASIMISMLLFSWVNRATSYSSMGSYYEDMYSMETHHRGYIQSYQQVLGFIAQSTMIGPVLSRIGGERQAVCWSALLLAVATFMEIRRSVPFFLIAVSPAVSFSVTMMNVGLQSLLTRVAPQDSIFSVFAALDVLQNASAVTVPFYRTFLFRLLGANSDGKQLGSLTGDPDPIRWVLSSGTHWVVATCVLTYLLRPDRRNHSLTERKKDQ